MSQEDDSTSQEDDSKSQEDDSKSQEDDSTSQKDDSTSPEGDRGRRKVPLDESCSGEEHRYGHDDDQDDSTAEHLPMP